MENSLEEWERKNLINELIQGKDLAMQLQFHLSSPSSSSSSHETRELLAFGILDSCEKALAILNWRYPMGETSPAKGGPTGAGPSSFGRSESPPSLGGGGGTSGDSDRDFRDLEQNGAACNKRKDGTRWTKQIRLDHGADLEGSLEDGHSWRKYGQKDILGAKFPRGYYRCTHRTNQGCLATKQVQRSDQDPSVYTVTYRGMHTCGQPSRGININPQFSIPHQNNHGQRVTEPPPDQQNMHQNLTSQEEILESIVRGLKVITEDLNSQNHPSFPPPYDNLDLPGHFSAPFASPGGATINFQGNTDQIGFQIVESDHLSEIVSAASSRTNTTGASAAFGHSIDGFNPNNPFGGPGFFN
ncbi:hypothetical protein SAY87_027172 [Trapa incisa]|uniref:WRKY domain-containing protein n=1 Tax=Trapa incisa TaxID=236973 RepID=A0AAN7JMG9_9MYRT|nr:hypothetical protein SAY87_027172 [Trapa incisa]